MRRIIRWTWAVALVAACGGGEPEEGAAPAVVDSAAYQRRVASLVTLSSRRQL